MENNFFLNFVFWNTSVLPKEITGRLNVVPDTELKQGERNKVLNLPRYNLWSLRSTSRSDDVLDHWNELAEKFQGKRQEIKKIGTTGIVKIVIAIQGHSSRLPPIKIPAEMSEFAGYIGAVIDIDHIV